MDLVEEIHIQSLLYHHYNEIYHLYIFTYLIFIFAVKKISDKLYQKLLFIEHMYY